MTVAATMGAPSKVSPNLSIVVPCYNEESVLKELCARLEVACEAAGEGNFEIVLVNDGSRDGTWTRIVELCGRDRGWLP